MPGDDEPRFPFAGTDRRPDDSDHDQSRRLAPVVTSTNLGQTAFLHGVLEDGNIRYVTVDRADVTDGTSIGTSVTFFVAEADLLAARDVLIDGIGEIPERRDLLDQLDAFEEDEPSLLETIDHGGTLLMRLLIASLLVVAVAWLLSSVLRAVDLGPGP